MRAGIVYMRPKVVVFVRASGGYAEAGQKAWAGLIDWIGRNRLKDETDCGYSLVQARDGDGADPCVYDACAALPDWFIMPSGDMLPTRTLPGGAYARMRHVGPFVAAEESAALIRSEWLSRQAGLAQDDQRPLLVIHLEDPIKPAVDRPRSDVCLPVRVEHAVLRRPGAQRLSA